MLELKKECVNLDLQASSKDGVLKELSAVIEAAYEKLEKGSIFPALHKREQIGSTGIGHGIAIPHAKLEPINNEILCFGRSISGVPFEAIDNRPVYLFAVLLAPDNIAAEYLRALAFITTTLKKEANRENLLHTDSQEVICDLFSLS